MFYSGHSSYLCAHSTRQTLAGNSAIAWAVGCLCMLLGAGILAAVFALTGGGANEVEIAEAAVDEIFGQSLNSSSAESGHVGFRTFSDTV